MKIRNQQDFYSGLMFMGVGIAFALGSRRYVIGTAGNMGPGYFPLMLGILLVLLGGAILISQMVVKTADGGKIGRLAWKPLCFIIAANLVFGVTMGGLPMIGLPALGLIVGIYLLTFLAALSAEGFKLKEAAILATVLAVICYIVFIVALHQQITVWPTFIAQ
jgi:hypothetical protein